MSFLKPKKLWFNSIDPTCSNGSYLVIDDHSPQVRGMPNTNIRYPNRMNIRSPLRPPQMPVETPTIVTRTRIGSINIKTAVAILKYDSSGPCQ